METLNSRPVTKLKLNNEYLSNNKWVSILRGSTHGESYVSVDQNVFYSIVKIIYPGWGTTQYMWTDLFL